MPAWTKDCPRDCHAAFLQFHLRRNVDVPVWHLAAQEVLASSMHVQAELPRGFSTHNWDKPAGRGLLRA